MVAFIRIRVTTIFWLVFYEDKEQWIIIKSSILKKYVQDNKDKLKTWCTSTSTESKNRSYNRTYDRSEGVMINISTLAKLGQLKELTV